jgi:hypothetical protein
MGEALSLLNCQAFLARSDATHLLRLVDESAAKVLRREAGWSPPAVKAADGKSRSRDEAGFRVIL